jgi:hypothetical protein
MNGESSLYRLVFYYENVMEMKRNSLPHSNVREDTSRNCVMNFVGKTKENGSSLNNPKCYFGGKMAITEGTVKRVDIAMHLNAVAS